MDRVCSSVTQTDSICQTRSTSASNTFPQIHSVCTLAYKGRTGEHGQELMPLPVGAPAVRGGPAQSVHRRGGAGGTAALAPQAHHNTTRQIDAESLEDDDGLTASDSDKSWCCRRHFVPFCVVVGSTMTMLLVPLITLVITVGLVAMSFWPVIMVFLPFIAAGWFLSAVSLLVLAWNLRHERGRYVVSSSQFRCHECV